MKDHLTTVELSERWSVHVNTLQRWRTEGDGPKFVRLGLKRILYPVSEVEAYESKTFASTSESDAFKNDPGVTQRKRT